MLQMNIYQGKAGSAHCSEHAEAWEELQMSALLKRNALGRNAFLKCAGKKCIPQMHWDAMHFSNALETTMHFSNALGRNAFLKCNGEQCIFKCVGTGCISQMQ